MPEAVVKVGLSRPTKPYSKEARLDPKGAAGFLNSGVEEPWVLNPNKFSAPLADQGAFSSHAGNVGQKTAKSGFLGKAVGSVHENLKYWKDTFETDTYITSILEKGYRIPVKMSKAERTTAYRERNNQSARNEMPFVRSEVARLLADGQTVESKTPVLCTNPLSVAFKVNTDGSIKKRLVIDLSR
jgi:hypothetical protein